MKRRTIGMNVGQSIAGFFVFMLIVLFCCLSMVLIALGTQAYHSISIETQDNLQVRTSLNYVMNRIRSMDELENIRIESFASGDAIIFVQQYDDEQYELRIFCTDGELREQFTSADVAFDPEDGVRLADLERMNVRWMADALLELEFTYADQDTHTIHAAIKSQM